MTQSLSLRTRTRSTSTPIATSPRGILNTWLRRISRNTTFEIGLGVIASNKEMNVYELRYFNIAKNNGRGRRPRFKSYILVPPFEVGSVVAALFI